MSVATLLSLNSCQSNDTQAMSQSAKTFSDFQQAQSKAIEKAVKAIGAYGALNTIATTENQNNTITRSLGKTVISAEDIFKAIPQNYDDLRVLAPKDAIRSYEDNQSDEYNLTTEEYIALGGNSAEVNQTVLQTQITLKETLYYYRIYWDPYTVTKSIPITYPEVKCSWRKGCITTWRTEYVNYTYTYWVPKTKLESTGISIRQAYYYGNYDCSSPMSGDSGFLKVKISQELWKQGVRKCGEYENGEIVEAHFEPANNKYGWIYSGKGGNYAVTNEDGKKVIEMYGGK